MRQTLRAGVIPNGIAGDFALILSDDEGTRRQMVKAVRRIDTPRGMVVQFLFAADRKAVSRYADEPVTIEGNSWGRFGPVFFTQAEMNGGSR